MLRPRTFLRYHARGGFTALLRRIEASAGLHVKGPHAQESAPFKLYCSSGAQESKRDRQGCFSGSAQKYYTVISSDPSCLQRRIPGENRMSFSRLSHRFMYNGSPSTRVRCGFSGKVVMITGAASGIGEATARLFVANGAQVVIADVNDEKGQKLSKELGAQTSFVHCDVTKEEDVAAAVDKTMSLTGHLNIFFSNAGIVGALGAIDQLNLQEFDETIAVNLRGMVVGIKHAARVMKPAKSGSIICTGSTASKLGGLAPHTYSICKTALKGLVRSTAAELRRYGIRVNMVSPDATPTRLFAKALESSTGVPYSLEQTKERLAKRSLLLDRPLGELDIANAVLFLASEEAGYISGQNLLVDAANTVTRPFPPGFDLWFTGHAPMIK